MINFYCKCGQLMSVRDDFAGRQGNCPRCRGPFTVPAQSTAAPPGAAPPPAQQSPPPRPTATTQAHDVGALRAPTPGPSGQGSAGAPRLEVVHGPGNLQGKTFQLLPGRSMVLGRDPGADLTIESDRVSRRHCQFVPAPDGTYVLEDLGSANGTLVNQARIQGRQVLAGGEYIQAGDCLFRYCG